MSQSNVIRILIADDHPILRQALTIFLESESGIDCSRLCLQRARSGRIFPPTSARRSTDGFADGRC
ncbi:hypothetical protein [Nostoc sp.]|uniref:hypothetical protein n=1 Tax=Nostoc sp. TaxID=1180 RepID=UPI002FF6B1CF